MADARFKKKKTAKVSLSDEECNVRDCTFEFTNDLINMKENNCSPNELILAVEKRRFFVVHM